MYPCISVISDHQATTQSHPQSLRHIFSLNMKESSTLVIGVITEKGNLFSQIQ